MKLSNFNQLELQKIRFHYKIEDMVKLFEGDPVENKKFIIKNTVSPIIFVKSMPFSVFIYHLVNYGYSGMSKRFGVSEAFLKSVALEKLSKIDNFCVDFDVDKIGINLDDSCFDHSTVAKIFGKKIKGNLNVDGGMEVHLGRYGELYYKNLRKDKIVRDFNETDPRSLYDFEDSEFGLVNVKTSSIHHRKEGEIYWKFSTSSGNETKFLVCICLGLDKNVEYILRVPYKNADRGSFSIDRSELIKKGIERGVFSLYEVF